MLGASVWFSWKKGTSAANKEVIDIRDKQVEVLREEVKSLNETQIKDRENHSRETKELIGKIGELTGQLLAKNEQNKMLTDLLTNRNPEMEEFFKQFRVILPTLAKVPGLMEKIDNHLTIEKN